MDELNGIREWASRIDAGKVLMVSGEGILRNELLLGAMPPDQQQRFHALTKRRSVQLLPYDPQVETLTTEIREYYRARGLRTPKTPDATHLAYALHYGVDEFHTFDGNLLALGNAVAGRTLVIRKPLVDQQVLFL